MELVVYGQVDQCQGIRALGTQLLDVEHDGHDHDWLLEFYVLIISKVMSGLVPPCDSEFSAVPCPDIPLGHIILILS